MYGLSLSLFRGDIGGDDHRKKTYACLAAAALVKDDGVAVEIFAAAAAKIRPLP